MRTHGSFFVPTFRAVHLHRPHLFYLLCREAGTTTILFNTAYEKCVEISKVIICVKVCVFPRLRQSGEHVRIKRILSSLLKASPSFTNILSVSGNCSKMLKFHKVPDNVL